MKTFKLKNIFLGLGMLASVGCTDLSETTYDIVPQDGFYQTYFNAFNGFRIADIQFAAKIVGTINNRR